MEKKDMLLALIEHYSNGNKTQFAKILGISPQGLNTWISRNTFDAECIYSKCLNVSANWLLTGEGSMLVDEGAAPTPSVAQPVTNDAGTAQMVDRMLEMAKEIGRLQEQVRQLTIEQEKTAARANTASIANVG